MTLKKKDIHTLAFKEDTYISFLPQEKNLIEPAWNSNEFFFVDSLYFAQVSIKQEKFTGLERPFNIQSESIFSVFFLLQFILYAYVFVRFKKLWTENIKQFLIIKERTSFFIDSSVQNNRQSIYLSILTAINLGFFLYLYLTQEIIYLENQSLIIFLSLLISLTLFVLKYWIINFLGFVFFDSDSAFISFKNNMLISFSFLGVFILFILLLLIYSPLFSSTNLFLTAFLAYISFMFLSLYKVIKYFNANLYSFFYLILYLCIFEILPIIILFLLLNNVINLF